MAEMEFGVVEPNAQLAPQDWRTKIRESRYGTLIVLVFTAIIVICAAWFGSGLQDGENSLAQNKSADLAATAANSEVTDQLAILEVGKPAPDFTFVDSAGARVQLADYRGNQFGSFLLLLGVMLAVLKCRKWMRLQRSLLQRRGSSHGFCWRK
ncbi:hypothetical protein [Arcanobacterium hippocoleae]|uniref:hypothetical protein n=1 Tax=Arcanobacterium hippocoleae TaxID=149017 RepID=UPI00333FB4DE